MNNFWQQLTRPFLVLAPMENVTNYVFREIVATKLPKPDVFFTEFTNVDALNSGGFERTIERFKFSPAQQPIVAQIWGTNPDHFLKAAQLVRNLGFSGIDINMGCPDRAVMKIGAGSALINNQNLVKEIIVATKQGAQKLPVSVKTRIGIKDVVTQVWVKFLLEQNLAALTVHGRTAKQLSEVPANWHEISQLAAIRNEVSPQTVLVGNGDVKSYTEAQAKSTEFGVDGIMIGRGIFANPWVFEKNDSQAHSPAEHIQVLISHLQLFESEGGGKRHYEAMKKFFKMYINQFDGASQLRAQLMDTHNSAEALEILDQVRS